MIETIINNRVVCVMVPGKSIEELENKIEEYRDCDICWVSLNLFTVMEDYILSKINKKLDIILDCSTVAESLSSQFERIRLPRIEDFLKRSDNNLWLTTHGFIRDIVTIHKPNWLSLYDNKIMIIDSIFPKDNIAQYMSVPNSLTLLIACLVAGKAKKIILFGLDGCKTTSNNISTYYKPEMQAKDKILAVGDVKDVGIPRDSNNFEIKFTQLFNTYKSLFNHELEIYNCSPNSEYNCITKINYDQVKGLL